MYYPFHVSSPPFQLLCFLTRSKPQLIPSAVASLPASSRFFPTSTRRLLVLQSLSVALQQYACTLPNTTKEQLLLEKEKK